MTLLAGVKPGETVIDLCAGAGARLLALAALMANRGSLYATDLDSRRLAPLHDRVARSGASIVEVRIPRSRGHEPLADVAGQADLVLVDAPCTGSGTWRRNPDAKWRVRPGALAERVKDQAEVLARAAELVRSPAAASPTSPARCCRRRMTRRSAPSSAGIRASRRWHRSMSSRGRDRPLPCSPVSPPNSACSFRRERTGTDGFYLACLTRGD